MKLSAVYIVLLLLSVTLQSQAGQVGFNCTVVSAHLVNESGNIIDDTPHLLNQRGDHFYVDRDSGEIRGHRFVSNQSAVALEVVNEPRESSYYVHWRSPGPFVMVGYLYIANYISLKSKPFTFTSNGAYFYSGHCS